MKRYPVTRNGELVGSIWCNSEDRVTAWIVRHNEIYKDNIEYATIKPDCVSSLIVAYHDLETNETEVGSYE